MYSVQQLQAIDYLLKRMLRTHQFPFYEKNLKFVIEINGTHWYGDFIELSGSDVKQLFIDDGGDVDHAYLYATTDNATSALKKVWDSYTTQVGRLPYGNPFRRITDLPLLFNSLVHILDLAEVGIDDSPIYPYLLNAKSLDESMELPFLNIGPESVKLVSLIEVQ